MAFKIQLLGIFFKRIVMCVISATSISLQTCGAWGLVVDAHLWSISIYLYLQIASESS